MVILGVKKSVGWVVSWGKRETALPSVKMRIPGSALSIWEVALQEKILAH